MAAIVISKKLGNEQLTFIQDALKAIEKLNDDAADIGVTVDVVTFLWADGSSFGKVEWDDADIGGWAFS